MYICFAQREYDLYFYVKRDCLLFSVNVKLFFEFFVMREKANSFAWRCFQMRYRGPSYKLNLCSTLTLIKIRFSNTLDGVAKRRLWRAINLCCHELGGQTVEKMHKIWINTKLKGCQLKSTALHARPGKTKIQIDSSDLVKLLFPWFTVGKDF